MPKNSFTPSPPSSPLNPFLYRNDATHSSPPRNLDTYRRKIARIGKKSLKRTNQRMAARPARTATQPRNANEPGCGWHAGSRLARLARLIPINKRDPIANTPNRPHRARTRPASASRPRPECERRPVCAAPGLRRGGLCAPVWPDRRRSKKDLIAQKHEINRYTVCRARQRPHILHRLLRCMRWNGALRECAARPASCRCSGLSYCPPRDAPTAS